MKKPNNIPEKPGVYFFLDARGKRLYIGKASVLKNRLGSYFRAEGEDPEHKRGTKYINPRIQHMLETATRVDWQETGSEIEALILESQFIKKYKPPYNISLRDDKSYSYVAFTQEEFPKVFVTHAPKSYTAIQLYSSKAFAIGPFTSSIELRAALKTLRKLFPYCTCKKSHARMCLNGHLKLCFGFCCIKELTTTAEMKMYRASTKALRDVLSGKRRSILNQRMIENTKVIKEIAGREDALTKLMQLMKLLRLPLRIEGYDISNIQGVFATGSMVVFENGTPNKSEYRKFKIHAPASPDDTRMLGEMLARRFGHSEWAMPDVLLIDGGRGQLNAARKALQLYSSIAVELPILSIAKGKNELFSTTVDQPVPMRDLPQAVRDLIMHIDAEAHRFAITYYRKLHGKSNLKR
ncbi:MAG: hypothetical protein A3A33_03480 [Candidatus Yanofskybacteria bacterium RIFCSPLOWO2_01_FULL_49_25]|uniref:Excinuclease ABC subunit C n=1 Tax=Candidatus Yanofskybacteria bacterium RIFCSPLOWO2_01_FULL_49_25 TaxID=1802701 RepID=A0A1F8GTQ7_9BACT|nr:MAG: hypothetical protein A3A33_03480 [Candidatus Yanofskybacteria bacterium RIFCSPLOWO2_01_FULL_49_25]